MAHISLGHDNAYVRAATAGAIAEAAERWPESVPNVLLILQEFYREKAKILAPEFDQYVCAHNGVTSSMLNLIFCCRECSLVKAWIARILGLLGLH